jgi:phosphonopyruvate decarboxylase
MISASDFSQRLLEAGFNFATGVPCSLLTPLLNYLIAQEGLTYVGATNEGQAVAMAAGATVAGRGSVVLMQNSGLCNAIDPLTSLNTVFGLPVLLIVSWRGEQSMRDEPQHRIMGTILQNLLDLIGIPAAILPREPDAAFTVLHDVITTVRQKGRTVAIIVREKTFETTDDCPAFISPRRSEGVFFTALGGSGLTPSRYDALVAIDSALPEQTVLITTTGKTSRELFCINDAPRNLYIVGSMGLASSLGLGLSMSRRERVVIVDGDGAALMHMGSLATIGSYGGSNLTHIVLDNGCHDSTGGQPTVSGNVRFGQIGAACGYALGIEANGLNELGAALHKCAAAPGPQLLHIHVRPGSLLALPRPALTPEKTLARLRKHLNTFPVAAEPSRRRIE